MAVANEGPGREPVETSPGRGDSGAAPGAAFATTSDPLNRFTGMIWFRTDTLQMCVDVGGTVRRSAAFT